MEEMTLTETETTELDKLQLVPFTDPKLREVPQDFDFENEDAKELKDKLITAMREFGGVGLSANQVGIDKKCFVIGDEGDFTKAFFNMEIIGASEEEDSIKEGCLSFPEHFAEIDRPDKLTIEYLDEKNEKQILSTDGFTSRIIQHELDHLNGILFVDHLSRLKRDVIIRKMKKFKKEQNTK